MWHSKRLHESKGNLLFNASVLAYNNDKLVYQCPANFLAKENNVEQTKSGTFDCFCHFSFQDFLKTTLKSMLFQSISHSEQHISIRDSCALLKYNLNSNEILEPSLCSCGEILTQK